MGDVEREAGPPAWLDELHVAPGPPWHSLGTRTLDPSAWLVEDADRPAQLAMKRLLLAEHRDVVLAISAPARAGADEAAHMVAAATGLPLDPGRQPLEAAALLVQEDLCVLVRRDGRWCLDAGVVCFPSLWRLPDKLGLPMAQVHGPVPAYDTELAGRVDRFLDHLSLGRVVWRRNWFIHDTDALHLPVAPAPPPRLRVPEGLWIRSERQTLRRLERTGAILFTIRTQHAPLAVLKARPDLAARMAAAVAAWPDELVAYRGAGRWRAETVAWLAAVGG